ncbi:MULTISPECIES: VMAP-C domain-containing protein [unclassified Streptomyces]|uniref:VMAP-C domain-containing protein n=1 Tax=unclassified Streptomyces TaxID=2593676 RepID=UPI003450063A
MVGSARLVPDRLVEISVRDDAGRQVGYGSGWVIDADLVVTAAHLLVPEEPPDGPTAPGGLIVEVRQGMHAAHLPWHPCEIVWSGLPHLPERRDSGPAQGSRWGADIGPLPSLVPSLVPSLDAALLVVTGSGWVPPEPGSDPHLGLVEADITEFQIFGFPSFNYEERHAHNPFQGGGRLRPANLARSELMALYVAEEDCPESGADWGGISGAAVLVDQRRTLVGVVLRSDIGSRRKLTVLPVEVLLEDVDCRLRLSEHTGGLSEPRNRRKVLAEVRALLERAEPLRGYTPRLALLRRLFPDVAEDAESACLPGECLLPLLVDRCAQTPTGMSDLVAAYEQAHPKDRAVAAGLHFRVDELEALRQVGPEGWVQLRAVLTRLYESDLNEMPVSALYARATKALSEGMPAHCDGLWKAFVNLAGSNMPSEGLPPAVHFLELVASAVGGATAGEIQAYSRAWALRLETARQGGGPRTDTGWPSLALRSPAPQRTGYQEQVDALRSSLVKAPVQPAASAKLLVELEPDPGNDPDDWAVSFYFRCRPLPGTWLRLPLPHTERSIRLADLPARLELARERLQRDYGVPRERIDVEYVLPLDLIDHPDTLIRRGALPEFGMSFPVIVHSRDRMRHPPWCRTWRERWRPLSGQPEAGRLLQLVRALSEDGREFEGEEPVAGLVLAHKPSSVQGRKDVTKALRHGVPLVMWRHDERAQPDFSVLFTRIMSEGGLDVREYGRDDGGGDGTAPPWTAGWHQRIVIIYDTPDGLPELIYGAAS